MTHQTGLAAFLDTAFSHVKVMSKDLLDFVRWSIHLLRRRLNISPPASPPLPPQETIRAMTQATEHACECPKPLVHLGECLELDPHTGRVRVLHRNEAIIEGATASVHYRVDGQPVILSLASPRVAYEVTEAGLRVSQKDDHLRLDWCFNQTAGLESWLEIRNVGQIPVQIDHLHILDLKARDGGRVHIGAAPRRWSIYQHGWASWTPVFARHLAGSMHVIRDDEQFARMHLPHGNPDETGTISSEWVTVLWGRGGRRREAGAPGILLGFVTGADQLAEVRIDVTADAFAGLQALSHADGITLPPGESLNSERLSIAAGDNPLNLLEAYSERLGQEMQARTPAEIPTGWCTWYYFFGENGDAEILENLAEIERENLPFDYVLIDDGYQQAIGDWLTLDTEKFSDMAGVVQAIQKAGRRAGIWLAPFGLDAQSTTYQAHPDWVVRDDDGEPVLAWQHFGQDIYALDLTHPEVEPWLAGVFQTMRNDWGVELFKIDFIFSACAAGRRHDPNSTRAQAFRRGLEIVRQAIGEDAFLLGCGAPQLPCVGVVDGMRVGPDVAGNWHPFWPDLSMPSAENAMRNSITRYFTHGRLWVNDPDCVLVRDKDDQSDLVLSEMRSLVGIIALLGGITLSSDNLPTLRKGRFKYLEQMFPPTNLSARPLDLFDNELPQCLALQVERPWGQWLVAGIINWQDRTMTTDVDLEALGLPAGRYHIFNYWPRRYMGVAENVITLDRHLPHETIILLIKPVSDEPELLTTTFHVAQTLAEVMTVERDRDDDGSITLKVVVERAGDQFGELWFTFPPALKLDAAAVNGRKRKVSSDGVGVAHLGLSPNGVAEITLTFVPVE